MSDLPSAESCRALLAEIEPSGEFIRVRPMGADGTHPAFVLEARSAAGITLSLAVKCYQSGFGRDVERARVEFQTLSLLQKHAVPVPDPIYLDAAGRCLGLPTLVTSFMSGTQLFGAEDPAQCARELAQTLAKIHSVPISENERTWLADANQEVLWFRKGGALPAYLVNHPAGLLVWNTVERLLPMQQVVPSTFVHTDYWIGQVLWEHNQITAVFDWEEAGYGDPGYDVAYCFMDLYLGQLGPNVAEEFLKCYQAEVGHPVNNLEFWQYAVIPRVLHNAEWTAACQHELSAYITSLADARKTNSCAVEQTR